MKGIVPIMMIVSVIIAGFVVAGLAQSIRNFVAPASNTVLRHAKLLSYNRQSVITQIILYHGDDSAEIKEDFWKLLNISHMSPHELATSSIPAEITDATFIRIDDALKSPEKVNKNILDSIFMKCAGWLTINNPGAREFAVTSEMVGAFYTDLLGESEGGFNILKPASVSQAVNENLEALRPLFVSGGVNTVNCAECWTLREEYLNAINEGLDYEAIRIEGQIRDRSCAESCGRVCENIYPTMKLLSLAHGIINADADGQSPDKALILTEITLD